MSDDETDSFSTTSSTTTATNTIEEGDPPPYPLYEFPFSLPSNVIWELAAVLDVADNWEDVAASMPGISDIDIHSLRKESATARPTEALFNVWSSMGYSTLQLFKVFFDLKYLRCMSILLPYVDEHFQQFAKEAAWQSEERTLPKRRAPSPPPSYTSHEKSVSGARSPEVSKHNHVSSSLVYSKKKINNSGSEILSSIAASDLAGASASTENSTSSFIAGLQNTPAVKYEDILEATNQFAPDRILGRGGYGVVYKGVWKHTEVAIKRIQGRKENSAEQQKERIRQSLQELRTLAKFRHDNVLSLYGYSMDGAEPCLIYQFMSNGSLEDRLLCRNGSPAFSWALKLAVCKGISCGLHFLHSIGNAPIIHGDVKSANILLDKHMEPKLGDFGLSRDGQVELDGVEKSPMIASHIKGTLAYLPPEFTTSKILTTKLDVYSFGVVLLEVATGQRAYSNSREPPNLVDYTLKTCSSTSLNNEDERQKVFEQLADKRTPDSQLFNKAILERLLKLGINCTQKDRYARPLFTEIFGVLSQ